MIILECNRTYDIYCAHDPKFIKIWNFDKQAYTSIEMCQECWKDYQTNKVKRWISRWNHNKRLGLQMKPKYTISTLTTLYTCAECNQRIGTMNHHMCANCKLSFCVDCVIETECGTTLFINCPNCKACICSGAMDTLDKIEELV